MSHASPRVLQLETEDFAQLAESVLRDGHALRFAARGTSMLPAIADGDIVTVAPLGNRGLKRGDVLLCKTPGGKVLLHRLVGPRPCHHTASLHVRGDAATHAPETIARDAVLGRATQVTRNDRTRPLGTAARWLGLLRIMRRTIMRRLR